MHGIEDSDVAYYVGKPAWHGLGTVVDYATPTWWEDCGVGAEITEHPVLDEDGYPIAGYKYLRHSGNGQILHIHKDSYKVIQPGFLKDCADILSDFGATPSAAFTLAGGKEAAVVLDFGQPLILPAGDDKVYPYVIMHTAHDGSASFTLRGSTIRAECRNMLNMAFSQSKAAKDQVYRITHKGNVESKQEDLKAAISGIKRQLESFESTAAKLAETTINCEDFRDVTEAVYLKVAELDELPVKALEYDDKGTKNRYTRWLNFRDGVQLKYYGRACDEIRDTAWGALNAFTEYYEWEGNSRDRSSSRLSGPISRKRELAAAVVADHFTS